MSGGLDWFETTIRAATGTLSVAETGPVVTLPGHHNQHTFTLSVTTVTTPDADDEVRFWLQTTYDNGTTWRDLANVLLTTAHNGVAQARHIEINPAASATNIDTSDAGTGGGALADNAVHANLPIADRVRVKTTTAGATLPSYAYTCLMLSRSV